MKYQKRLIDKEVILFKSLSDVSLSENFSNLWDIFWLNFKDVLKIFKTFFRRMRCMDWFDIKFRLQ